MGISQAPRHDFGVLEDEYIEQRICLGFKEATIAEDTLRWCNRDLDRHPKLLTDYVTNTSPAQMMNYGDDAIDSRHGKVIPGRARRSVGARRIRRLGQGAAVLRADPRAGRALRHQPCPQTHADAQAERMMARAHYWLLRHPRVGRPLMILACAAAAGDHGGVHRPGGQRIDQQRDVELDRPTRHVRGPDRRLLPVAGQHSRPDHPGRTRRVGVGSQQLVAMD